MLATNINYAPSIRTIRKIILFKRSYISSMYGSLLIFHWFFFIIGWPKMAGQEMGWPRYGLAKKWAGQEMGWPRHGLAKTWAGQNMGWPKHGLAKIWAGQKWLKKSWHKTAGQKRQKITLNYPFILSNVFSKSHA